MAEWLPLSAVLAATACIGLGVIATQAFADSNLGSVDGLTYFQDTVPIAAAPAEGGVTADCQPGAALFGGGTTPSSSPLSDTWINTTIPVDGPDAGSELDGMKGRIANLAGGSKSASAYAVCTAGGISSRSARTRIDVNRGGGARADCPAGTRVAGGGASLTGPASRSYLNSSHPFDDGDQNSKPDDGWRARAFNNASTMPRLRVIALCVEQPPVYEHFESSGGLLFAPCPVGGHALAGGIEADGAARAGHMSTAYPYADPANPPDRGFVVAMGSTWGSGPSYTAHVICTRP